MVLLRSPKGKVHYSKDGAHLLCDRLATGDATAATRTDCRRCIKLAEINRGLRKGRKPKKTGTKFRQRLLMGGERRNGHGYRGEPQPFASNEAYEEYKQRTARAARQAAQELARRWDDYSLLQYHHHNRTKPPEVDVTQAEWRQICTDELARRGGQVRTNGRFAPAQDRFVFVTVEWPGGVKIERWRLGDGSASDAKKRVRQKVAEKYGVTINDVQVGEVMHVTR